MDPHEQLARLSRQVRTLRATTALMALILGAGVLASFAPQDDPWVEVFDEITVGRINIAGPDGVNRIVLAHEMPTAPFQGKEVPRTVPPGLAGMIFCAPNGDEIGGIGASAEHSLITLDYRDVPLEAIGLSQRNDEGVQSAALVVMENPRGKVDLDKILEGDPEEVARFQSMMINRATLGIDAHEASLRLRDGKGRERIVLAVDAKDQPRIQILDEHGQEVARFP